MDPLNMQERKSIKIIIGTMISTVFFAFACEAVVRMFGSLEYALSDSTKMAEIALTNFIAFMVCLFASLFAFAITWFWRR